MVNKNGRNRCRIAGSLWIIIILGGGLIFVFDIFSQTRPAILSLAVAPAIEKVAPKTEYIVKTPGCRIQYFNETSAEISQYIFKPEAIVCNNGTPPLVESNVSAIFVLNSSLPFYGTEDADDVSCCFTPFWSNLGNKVIYQDRCIAFKESATIDHDEFIKVDCTIANKINGTNILYTDFFSFAIPKTPKTKRKPGPKPLNVLVFGFDSISRINFHRQLPLTVAFLKNNLSAVELLGYNKVDDNTFPNLIPVLSGLTKRELEKKCWKSYTTTFDKCPFLWNDYKDAGFLTAFGEDAAWMGLFHYQRQGFRKPPTDYYWRTFSAEAEAKLGSARVLNCNTCIGSRPTYTFLWGYVERLVQVVRDIPVFSFFWETALSHDYLNSPALADAMYAASLRDLHAAGLLEDTAVVVMSDHGIRWGGIRYTTQGSYEDRLPGMFVSLPAAYRRRFPHVYANLRKNAEVLTTPFDLHETLRDLMTPFNLSKANIDARWTAGDKNPRNVKASYSLFERIPEERNCESARIPIHWCTCQNSIDIGTDDEELTWAANFLIKYVNKELLGDENCSALCLDKVLKATVQVTFQDNMVKDSSWVYKIIFRTQPGGGVFEGTVKKYEQGEGGESKKVQYRLEGGLSRLNVYGNQSFCVADMYLKLFCYCLK